MFQIYNVIQKQNEDVKANLVSTFFKKPSWIF
ncbi:MAG: hypothetical protein K0R71_1326 [Bacillales bacterium]|jgi:hypothetical protein|nr:hypothetical protein [Bacillales bacterium]